MPAFIKNNHHTFRALTYIFKLLVLTNTPKRYLVCDKRPKATNLHIHKAETTFFGWKTTQRLSY